ncbi:MAG: 2-hydroxyacid dehydrogenase, partial [Sphingomonadales bacterium]
MRVTIFGTKGYDRRFLSEANAAHAHDLVFLEPRLDLTTAPLAKGSAAVCVFVNDRVDADVLTALAEAGVALVALRCAGFNNVDLSAAARLGVDVVRVPAYLPHAVA